MSDGTIALPRDPYSTAMRDLEKHPEVVAKTSMIDLVDVYGNAETWVVKTLRVVGNDTVLLQRINAAGGDRWVLPPDVTAAIARHRDGILNVNRRRGAHKAAATRKAEREKGSR